MARSVRAWATVRRVLEPGFRSKARVEWGGIWDTRAEAEEWRDEGEDVLEIEVLPLGAGEALFPDLPGVEMKKES